MSRQIADMAAVVISRLVKKEMVIKIGPICTDK